jgi:hypothetical protein
MAKAPAPKKPSRVTVPPRAHPLARLVFAEMQRQGVTYEELSFRSNVLPHTFKAWRTDNTPGLSTIEACLGSLGWALVPVPRFEEVPENVRAGARALAAEWQNENRVLAEILATVCTKPIIVNTDGPVVATITPRRPKRLRVHPDQAVLFEGEAA